MCIQSGASVNTCELGIDINGVHLGKVVMRFSLSLGRVLQAAGGLKVIPPQRTIAVLTMTKKAWLPVVENRQSHSLAIPI